MGGKTAKKTPQKANSPADPVGQGSRLDTRRMAGLLCVGSLVLLSLIFAPISWWPLSFVCLVPWLVMVGGADRARRVYFFSYLLGLAFFLLNMRWLYAATGWGYLSLSLYLAAYFPLVACALRHAVRRRRWPLAVVVPLVWTGSEMLRAVVISGFPWFFLSHSLYGVLPLIQISDLVGAYGVSFMIAAVNGALADAVFVRLSPLVSGSVGPGRGRARFGAVFAVVLVLGTSIYGYSQLRRDTGAEGPKIALIQGDYPNEVAPTFRGGLLGGLGQLLNDLYLSPVQEHDSATAEQKLRTYLSMMEAASKEKPDLYLLPETPWHMLLNPEVREFSPISRRSFRALQEHATKHQAVVVTGSASLISTPNEVMADERRYNSATVLRPDGSEPGRYDKIHLVYFGEIVPFRFGRLRPLYFWINGLMPFSGPNHDYEYSIFRGDEFRRFSMEAQSTDGTTFRFGIPICYEDVMPYVSREFVSGGSNVKQVDFLLNISNDGWFGRGIQQPQHLAISVFRAVENRVGIARAVNTGVSAFIDPSGKVHGVVHGDPSTPWPGDCGYSIGRIGVDSRYTFYSQYGDWFPWTCAFAWLLLFCDYWIVRARTRAQD